MTLMFVCMWVGTKDPLAPYDPALADALADAARQMGGRLAMAAEEACLAAVKHHRKHAWITWAADNAVDPTVLLAVKYVDTPEAYVFDPVRDCGRWVPPSSLEKADMFLAQQTEGEGE
jgi:hypothetical protein